MLAAVVALLAWVTHGWAQPVSVWARTLVHHQHVAQGDEMAHAVRQLVTHHASTSAEAYASEALRVHVQAAAIAQLRRAARERDERLGVVDQVWSQEPSGRWSLTSTAYATERERRPSPV